MDTGEVKGRFRSSLAIGFVRPTKTLQWKINRFDNRHISLAQIESNRGRLAVLLCALFATFNLNCQSPCLTQLRRNVGKTVAGFLCVQRSMGALRKIKHFHLRAKHVTIATSSQLAALLYHKFMRAITLINIH